MYERDLSQLAIDSATEIDNYILGRSKNFDHTLELADVLQEYQLKDTDDAATKRFFPYIALWHAIGKNSDKEIRQYSELALEMRLLRSELNDVPNLPRQKLEELREFLCNLSREFGNEQELCIEPHRMAA